MVYYFYETFPTIFFFLGLFTFFFLGIFWFWENKETLLSPCLPPLKYSISPIDPQFGLTEENVLKALKEAEAVWEKPLGKDLFSYEEDASFVINFIYDKRQENTFHAQRLQDVITSDTSRYTQLVKTFDKTKENLDILTEKYNTLSLEYTKEFDRYNQEISSWNQQGGAPENIYTKLEVDRDKLDKKYEDISSLGKRINTLSSNVQEMAQDINQIAESINKTVNTHNTLFEAMPVFDKGSYYSHTITIYQFSAFDDLILTLAHELGHSLGISHTDNPTSIMYPMLGEQSTQPVMATEIDIASLRKACKFKPFLP